MRRLEQFMKMVLAGCFFRGESINSNPGPDHAPEDVTPPTPPVRKDAASGNGVGRPPNQPFLTGSTSGEGKLSMVVTKGEGK